MKHIMYCGTACGVISAETFLQEAVKYFKIRLEAGDNFTDGVLRRAERELAQLQTEKKN
jgi:hypothetical protein